MNIPHISINAGFEQTLARICADAGVDVSGGIALAVSGGGDSMALAVLAAQVLLPQGVKVKAYIVDHGLRPDARTEAEAAGRSLAALGIAHEILTWDGVKPQTDIQASARRARYALLADACRRDGFKMILTAHQAEDQMETFWMRLAHGSGIDGLAGMADLRVLAADVYVARPLLAFTRDDLRGVCTAAGVDWAEDPSNENDKFLRVRLRGFEQVLAGEGLTPQRLAQVMQKMADAGTALEHTAAEKYAAAVRMYPAGYAQIDTRALGALPDDIARRVLSRVLCTIAPADYPPGFDMLEKLRRGFAGHGAGFDFTGVTAYGCDVGAADNAGYVLVLREAAALPPPQKVTQETQTWDARFVLSGLPQGLAGEDGESLTLAALGVAGVAALRKQAAGEKSVLAALEQLPGKVRAGLPALWLGEKLLSVPHLSWHDAAAAPVLVEGLAGVRVSFPAAEQNVLAAGDCFADG